MRYASIDLLRTFAIVLMVLVHFLENLAGATWAPAGLGAPLFGFLVGVSYCIWLRSAESRGTSDSAITKSTIRRAVFLFLVGFGFNVLVWLPKDTFNWDVLTLIAIAFAVLALVRTLPPVVPLVFCVLVFVLSPVLRIEAGYNDYWLLGYYDAEMTLSDVTLGFLVTGYFPVFPWIIFPVVGYLVATRWLPEGPTTELLFLSVRGLLALGLALLVLFLLLRYGKAGVSDPRLLRVLTGWTMFPASLEYLAGILGAILLAFGLGLWLVDGRGLLTRLPWVLGVARTMSKYSFSIYLLHHVAHVWPMWGYALWQGQETTAYWRQALTWPWAAALVPVFLVACYVFFRWAERNDVPTVETAMRWFAD